MVCHYLTYWSREEKCKGGWNGGNEENCDVPNCCVSKRFQRTFKERELVWPFSSGFILCISKASRILISPGCLACLSTLKSSLFKSWFMSAQCERIGEKLGLVIWHPVRGEIPLCSAILNLRVLRVIPRYLHLHAEHVYWYTTLDIKLTGTLSLWGKNDLIVYGLVKTNRNVVSGRWVLTNWFSLLRTT